MKNTQKTHDGSGHNMGRSGKAAILLTAVIFLILLPWTACSRSGTGNTNKADDISGKKWDTSVPFELTDEVRELLAKASEGISDKEYVPIAVLGTMDGAYCILCKEIDPSNTEQKNVLVYVDASGIRNTYEIWIDKHDTKGQ